MARKAKVVEIPLMPGALSDDTDLAAKLHAIDMDKARSRGGRWETIKGVVSFSELTMTSGTARAIHTYADLDGHLIVVAASESAVNAWEAGVRYDITPNWKDVWLGVDAIEAGDTSTELVINWMIYDPANNTTGEASLHFLEVGDVVTFSGLINEGTETLNGSHTITATTSNSITISVLDNTDVDVNLPFICTVPFKAGLSIGVGDAVNERARIPTIDNFGENAVFCFSDGSPVFYWQPSREQPELITNGNFASDLSGWTAGTGWAFSSGAARHTGTSQGTLSHSLVGLLEQGKTYELSFDLTIFQSSVSTFRVQIDTVDIFPQIEGVAGNAQALRTYTFRFVCPPDPQLLMFIADASESTNDDVAIDNVSIALLSTAHVLNEAPQKNFSLFVDGNHVLNVVGSVEHDGDFNPLLLRWCAQDNYRDWISTAENTAGEFTLGKGSYAVCGRAVGERNLILTDDGAYFAQFTTQGYAVALIAQGCGCVGPQAIAVHNNRAFWAGLKGFNVFDGAQVLPIDCPIKDQYVGKLKQYQENKTYAWLNTEYNEIWYHYAHTDDGNEISRYVLYNFAEQGNPWGRGTMGRTCFTRASVFQHPLAVDTDGHLWFHETGNDMPEGALPFVETGYATAETGDQWLGMRRYYPDVEAQIGQIYFTVFGKRAPQGQLNTQTKGPYIMAPGDRTVDFLLSARQAKFRWESVDTPTYWRLGIVGLEVMAQRERR